MASRPGGKALRRLKSLPLKSWALLAQFMTRCAAHSNRFCLVTIDTGRHLHGEHWLDPRLRVNISMARCTRHARHSVTTVAEENKVGKTIDCGSRNDFPIGRHSGQFPNIVHVLIRNAVTRHANGGSWKTGARAGSCAFMAIGAFQLQSRMSLMIEDFGNTRTWGC